VTLTTPLLYSHAAGTSVTFERDVLVPPSAAVDPCEARFFVEYLTPSGSPALGPIILGANSNGISLSLHPGLLRVNVTVYGCDKATGNVNQDPLYKGESSAVDYFEEGGELSIMILALDTRIVDSSPIAEEQNFAPMIVSVAVSPLNVKPNEIVTIKATGLEINRAPDGVKAMDFAVYDASVCPDPSFGCTPVIKSNAADFYFAAVPTAIQQRQDAEWSFSLDNSMFDGRPGQDLIAAVTVYEQFTEGLSGSTSVGFYLDQLEIFDLGFVTMTRPELASVNSAKQTLSATFDGKGRVTSSAEVVLQVLDTDFSNVPSNYKEQHFLIVESLTDADVSYAFAGSKISAPSCGSSCQFVDCTCTRAANGNGCEELQVNAPSNDAPWELWTIRWDPWANVNVDSRTAGLYGTTYCKLKLHFHDNTATIAGWDTTSFAKNHPEGLLTRTLTILLEATPGNTATNMPPRAMQFWASNTNVDLNGGNGENVVASYFVQIEDDTDGTEASLGFLPDVCTNDVRADACFTPFTSLALNPSTCQTATGCTKSWQLYVSTAVSNEEMSGSLDAENTVHLRLVDRVTGAAVITQMPSVRIIGRHRARRVKASPKFASVSTSIKDRSMQFNIAVDGDGRLTASEDTPFLVEPNITRSSNSSDGGDSSDRSNGGVGSNGTDASNEQGVEGINATVAFTDNHNGSTIVDMVSNDTDVDADAIADNLLAPPWALTIASIVAFTALLICVIILAMLYRQRKYIVRRDEQLWSHFIEDSAGGDVDGVDFQTLATGSIVKITEI